MDIKLLRNDDGRGTLLVHFGKGVPQQEQVIFAIVDRYGFRPAAGLGLVYYEPQTTLTVGGLGTVLLGNSVRPASL